MLSHITMMVKRQMKKRIYLTSLLMLTGVNLLAQEVKMRDLFAAMPDSLLPLVTRNNRLDCIDFIENHLEARVKNKLDQYVELKKLTEDYLLFQTSQKGYLEMKYVPNTDSTGVLYLVRTCLGPIADSSVKCVNFCLIICKFRHLSHQTCHLFCQVRRISTLFCGSYLRTHIFYPSLN